MATGLTHGNGVPEHPPLGGAGAAASSTRAAVPLLVVFHPAEPDVEPVVPVHMEEVEDRVVPAAVDKVAWVLVKLHTPREIDDEESRRGEVQSQD
uniref:Uncharacterized protein n=1 Tax=Zea mays TaxID=4577 RepID=A0A804PH72_MAIZE